MSNKWHEETRKEEVDEDTTQTLQEGRKDGRTSWGGKRNGITE